MIRLSTIYGCFILWLMFTLYMSIVSFNNGNDDLDRKNGFFYLILFLGSIMSVFVGIYAVEQKIGKIAKEMKDNIPDANASMVSVSESGDIVQSEVQPENQIETIAKNFEIAEKMVNNTPVLRATLQASGLEEPFKQTAKLVKNAR